MNRETLEIVPMNEESVSLAEALGQTLQEIPQEELEAVVTMNRKQKREWLRAATKKRGKGYTR